MSIKHYIPVGLSFVCGLLGAQLGFAVADTNTLQIPLNQSFTGQNLLFLVEPPASPPATPDDRICPVGKPYSGNFGRFMFHEQPGGSRQLYGDAQIDPGEHHIEVNVHNVDGLGQGTVRTIGEGEGEDGWESADSIVVSRVGQPGFPRRVADLGLTFPSPNQVGRSYAYPPRFPVRICVLELR